MSMSVFVEKISILFGQKNALSALIVIYIFQPVITVGLWGIMKE